MNYDINKHHLLHLSDNKSTCLILNSNTNEQLSLFLIKLSCAQAT